MYSIPYVIIPNRFFPAVRRETSLQCTKTHETLLFLSFPSEHGAAEERRDFSKKKTVRILDFRQRHRIGRSARNKNSATEIVRSAVSRSEIIEMMLLAYTVFFFLRILFWRPRAQVHLNVAIWDSNNYLDLRNRERDRDSSAFSEWSISSLTFTGKHNFFHHRTCTLYDDFRAV